jgi:hypothetical protein
MQPHGPSLFEERQVRVGRLDLHIYLSTLELDIRFQVFYIFSREGIFKSNDRYQSRPSTSNHARMYRIKTQICW